MEVPKLTQGTIEYIVLDLKDELEGITTLVGAGLTYDIKDRAGANLSPVKNGLIGDVDDMQARCLIDTTSFAEGTYKLFIKFNALPEVPRLGPFDFQVNLD